MCWRHYYLGFLLLRPHSQRWAQDLLPCSGSITLKALSGATDIETWTKTQPDAGTRLLGFLTGLVLLAQNTSYYPWHYGHRSLENEHLCHCCTFLHRSHLFGLFILTWMSEAWVQAELDNRARESVYPAFCDCVLEQFNRVGVSIVGNCSDIGIEFKRCHAAKTMFTVIWPWYSCFNDITFLPNHS